MRLEIFLLNQQNFKVIIKISYAWFTNYKNLQGESNNKRHLDNKYWACYWSSRNDNQRIKNESRRIKFFEKENIWFKAGSRGSLFDENLNK